MTLKREKITKRKWQRMNIQPCWILSGNITSTHAQFAPRGTQFIIIVIIIMAASPKISSPFFGLTYQPLECYLMLVLFIAGPMSSQGSYSSHLYHGALKLSTCDHSKGFSVQDSLCRIVSSLTITPITRHYIILVVGAFLQVCRGNQVQFFKCFS